jgi:hypothetical protein
VQERTPADDEEIPAREIHRVEEPKVDQSYRHSDKRTIKIGERRDEENANLQESSGGFSSREGKRATLCGGWFS